MFQTFRPASEFEVKEIITKSHNTKYHCYSNYTQVYMTLKPCYQWYYISSSAETTIEDISTRMKSNMLKLNKDKSEFVVFSYQQHRKLENKW